MGSTARRFTEALALGAVACAAAAGTAAAGVSTARYVRCDGHEGAMGDFEALVTYAHEGEGTALVSVLLRNTTVAGRGGYITGLALNGGAGVSGMSFVSCSSASFARLSGPVEAPPFGSFLAGASTGMGWLGGGDPAAGIGVGAGVTFLVSVTGTAAALGDLTAETVFGSGPQMAVRFRGGTPGDWSDKALGCSAPAPGTVALLLAVGMLSSRRRA